jgi:hypothetical protein
MLSFRFAPTGSIPLRQVRRHPSQSNGNRPSEGKASSNLAAPPQRRVLKKQLGGVVEGTISPSVGHLLFRTLTLGKFAAALRLI